MRVDLFCFEAQRSALNFGYRSPHNFQWKIFGLWLFLLASKKSLFSKSLVLLWAREASDSYSQAVLETALRCYHRASGSTPTLLAATNSPQLRLSSNWFLLIHTFAIVSVMVIFN